MQEKMAQDETAQDATVFDERVQQQARARAQELPGAGVGHSFGPEWDVYKVKGKVFMLMTAVTGEPIVILKADPQDAKALRSEHEDITAGYHMNKQHWITVHPGGSIDPSLIDDLVTESYLLVVEKLPRPQRPVDPAAFGRGER
ncbi:MmcQ/YjbR family DNA-binding protein [Kineococcus sp. SYSU DK005]|uniref:MmcQ/YjbR family DNA-binding protein n=1 Tax=Kineococcus sp. SYSU DK005 TaxID=3383126 RepID=UPI003D7D3C08